MSLAVQNDALARRVGACVLVATATVVALLLAYGSCRVERSIRARVYFAHAEGLREGAPVQVAGVQIGEVAAIGLVPLHEAGPAPAASGAAASPAPATSEHALLAGTGGVAVVIRVAARRAYMAPVNGAYFMATRGVLGERYLAIGPPAGGAAPGRPLRDGDRVRGVDPPHVDRVLIRSMRNLQIADRFLDDVRPAARALGASLARLALTLRDVEPGPGALADAGAAITGAVAEARAVAETWRRGDADVATIRRLIDRSRAAAASLEAAIADVRGRVDRLQGELSRIGAHASPGALSRLARSLARARASLATLERAVQSGRELFERVRQGEGTIGGLLNDPEFSDDAKQVGKTIKRQPWKLIGRPRKSVD